MSKKQEILHETMKLFSEYGYNLSLTQVTGKIGLKKQSIYNYFVGKDELITEMLDKEIELYYNELKLCLANVEDYNPKEKLFKLTLFIVNFFKDSTRLRIRRWLALYDTYDTFQDTIKILKIYESYFISIIKEILIECMELELIKKIDIDKKTTIYVILVRGLVDGLLVSDKNYDQEEIIYYVIQDFWEKMKI